jgi:hypothetical protein
MMDERTDYQVLAPDSVAWYIQAALVADRTGNVAARDLALDKAKRIAAERQLTPDPGYDCRTAGERLALIDQRLDDLVERLAALETCVANLSLPHLASRVAYLERQAQVASGHKHDGGFWISCPFCVDDPLGMCSACNGTRRIWEMPREDK